MHFVFFPLLLVLTNLLAGLLSWMEEMEGSKEQWLREGRNGGVIVECMDLLSGGGKGKFSSIVDGSFT